MSDVDALWLKDGQNLTVVSGDRKYDVKVSCDSTGIVKGGARGRFIIDLPNFGPALVSWDRKYDVKLS